MTRRLLAVVLAGCLLAACSDDDASDDASSSSSTTSAEGTDDSTSTTAGAEGCTEEAIAAEVARVFANPDDPTAVPVLLGPADVDGDGTPELFAHTGTGASATIIGLAVQEGCTLTRVELPSGAPADFPVGGTVGASSGLACEASIDEDAHLSAHALLSLDGEQFELTTTEYALEGNVLVNKAERLRTIPSDDPGLGRYGGFVCGDLVAG